MRTSFILILLTSFMISSQAQISISGMNGIKINQTKTEVEKLLGNKLELKPDANGYNYFTEIIKDGVPLRLSFVKYDDEKEGSVYELYSISTESDKIKTLSGIGTGNSLEDLWNTYKDNYNISLYFYYDEDQEQIDKGKRAFVLSGINEDTIIYFYLKANKIYRIVVGLDEGC